MSTLPLSALFDREERGFFILIFGLLCGMETLYEYKILWRDALRRVRLFFCGHDRAWPSIVLCTVITQYLGTIFTPHHNPLPQEAVA